MLLSGADYFEKRGVVVFPQVSAKLNPAAQAYLDAGKSLPPYRLFPAA